MLSLLFSGFVGIFTDPVSILMIFVSVGVGIIFGAVPGLTAVTAIAMFIPVTYALSPTVGISTLVALYIGAISGGLLSAILLNMPGTPSSIATCFDGRPLALKGEAGKAIGVGIVFSFIGTLISIFALVFIAPPLASLTIKFGPWEYFSVTVLAMSLIASLTGKSVVKGLITGMLGLMFATVGLDAVDSVERFTFGKSMLGPGFDILPVLVGLYAISEVMNSAGALRYGSEFKTEAQVRIRGFGFSLTEFVSQIWNAVRSAIIGIWVGILPGIGGSLSNIIAYSVAKNSSKSPEKFGTGVIDGLVASETANNATIGGAMIPLLTLGIPGDGATAMLIGGFLLHGIQPGPLIFTSHAAVVYGIFAAMVVASLVMVLLEFSALPFFIRVLRVPQNFLLPVIIVLCTVGAFALNNRVFDIGAMIFFGVVGFTLLKLKYPLPPFILGFVLERTFEINLRRAMQYSQQNFMEILTRPFAVVFLAGAVLSIVVPFIRRRLSGRNA